MDNIVIYGAGIRGKRICNILKDTEIEILAVIDSDPLKWGSQIDEHIVYSPDKIKDYIDCKVCITIENQVAKEEIRNTIQKNYNYNLKNEILYFELIFEVYKSKIKLKREEVKYGICEKREWNVLFDCYNGLGLGGIEAWTLNVCEALLNKSYKNTYIICDMGKYDVSSKVEGKILYTHAQNKNAFDRKSVENILQVLFSKMPCKIVTSQINEVMLAGVLMKRIYPDMIEIISVMHNGDERTYEQYKSISNYVDVLIGVSEEIRYDMIARGIEPHKIYAMTCPFDCDKEITRSYSVDITKPIRIGYAGRIDKVGKQQKRMDLLLKFARGLDLKNINFIFEIAGDGPARTEMEAFVHANKLENKVQFLGTINRAKIGDFWKRQDIFVNFADYEGRCISKLEAMANGAVPITTNTIGTKEDIEDGVNGFIVTLGDYETMIEKVIYLEAHRERLKEMGMLAHERIYPKSKMENHIAFWEKRLDLK